VHRPAPLQGSKDGELAYFFSKEYKEELPHAHPTVLITAEPFLGPLEKSGLPLWSESVIVACPDPHLAMGILSEDFARELSTIAHLDRPEVSKIHPTAVVHPEVRLGKQVTIGPNCVIEAGARIGDGSVLYPSTYIGPEVTLGADCVLFPGVVIYEHCVLGDRVRIHANSVVGSDGFGYAPRKTAQGMAGHQKIHHLGRVVIGDDRILERNRRPTAVVVKREDVVELMLSEMNRLLDEQTKSYRSLVVDCELHEAPSA
jgi:UDP-3-O-[3-hydroxymyristoyl] glucosamine N-acyltransferase